MSRVKQQLARAKGNLVVLCSPLTSFMGCRPLALLPCTYTLVTKLPVEVLVPFPVRFFVLFSTVLSSQNPLTWL